MIIELKRKGSIITEAKPIDSPPMYNGTILYHEIAVRCQLYDGESLCVSYADENGNPITKAQMIVNKRFYNANDDPQSIEWVAKIPNVVMSAGKKFASIAILDLYQPIDDINSDNKYRVITSENIPFTIYPGSFNLDFEPIDESVSIELQRKVGKIIGLTQPPDISEAGLVGIPSVSILPDGRLKFSNLRGAAGINATIQWGVDAESKISTLNWKEV